MREQEKDRIGVVLHLTQAEYVQFKETWQFHLPESYLSTFDGLIQCRYAAIAVSEQWRAIAIVDKWSIATREGGPKVAKLGCLSEDVSGLQGQIYRDIAQIYWLNTSQREVILASLRSERAKCRPSPIPACLDLDAAAESVARCYGVDSGQVQVSIHRRSAQP